jgi:putative Mg2+ transporter-C (MgtC) family protein
VTTSEIVLRLLAAALAGGVVGYERQTHGRPAGLRTHLLVCAAASLVMVISLVPFTEADAPPVPCDPYRLAAGALTGIGFLGAGVIVKSGVTVQGLTTAASIWMVSVIGIAMGAGRFAGALTAMIVTLCSLWLLRLMEKRMVQHSYQFLTVVQEGTGDRESVLAVVGRGSFRVMGMEYERDNERDETTLHLNLAVRGAPPLAQVVDELATLRGVKRVGIRG